MDLDATDFPPMCLCSSVEHGEVGNGTGHQQLMRLYRKAAAPINHTVQKGGGLALRLGAEIAARDGVTAALENARC